MKAAAAMMARNNRLRITNHPCSECQNGALEITATDRVNLRLSDLSHGGFQGKYECRLLAMHSETRRSFIKAARKDCIGDNARTVE